MIGSWCFLRPRAAAAVMRPLLAGLAACLVALAAGPGKAQSKGKVLVLGGTVSGGLASIEAIEAAAQGYDVEIADDESWRGKSVSEFAGYRALILGDPDCGEIGTSKIQPAVDTVSKWGAAVNGNVIVIGTDPVFHTAGNAQPGAALLMRQAVDFALAQDGATGAYVALSCFFHASLSGTKVPLLDAFSPGGFTVTGVGCYDKSHLVAVHPALAGLSDAALSNWNCSIHEAFDKFPADFTPLAIAEDLGTSFTASDGTRGAPYILARGSQAFPFDLTPSRADNDVGEQQHLTATVQSIYGPLPNLVIGARVIDGPNKGLDLPCVQFQCKTDANGQVEFEYYGHEGLGEDTVLAWIDLNGSGDPDAGEPQTRALVRWWVPYVAIGDSTTTGWSVPLCAADMAKSRVKCLEDATHMRPAVPHPERIADARGLRPLGRVGIWGSTLKQMIAAYKRGFDVDDDAPGDEPDKKPMVSWIPQLKAATLARKLVTVSIGINDFNFSDVFPWGTAYIEHKGLEKADGILADMYPDLNVLFDTLDGVQRRGAQVVIVLYYNPYWGGLTGNPILLGPLLMQCKSLQGIGDLVVNKYNDELVSRAQAKGFTTADLRPAFDGHGSGSPSPYLFGTHCDIGTAITVFGSKLPGRDWDAAKAEVAKLYDPHPNNDGTTAQADTIEKVLR